MSNALLPLRKDLKLFKIESGEFILRDYYALSISEIVIDNDILPLLNCLDKEQTIDELSSRINYCLDNLSIASIYSQLVSYNLIENEISKLAIEEIEQYLSGNIRQAVCAGNSYPENIIELEKYLHNLLNTNPSKANNNIVGFIAPHIDFKLGEISHCVYSSVFSQIKESDFDTIVILGTAHYKSSDYLMFTKKNYSTPLGTLETDLELLNQLEQLTDITYDDLAHYPEHSIEFHIILLQYLFKNKKFTILPILTGTFSNIIESNSQPLEDYSYKKQISALKQVLESSNKKILFAASGDLSHIGQKFGDKFDALQKLEEVKIDDKALIDSLLKSDNTSFYESIALKKDSNRICGLAPFYTLLELIDPANAELTDYKQWYEKGTKSMVSYCGIAYSNQKKNYNKNSTRIFT